uniref:Uncharacterized protein n=1 Tax=Romanomermis culicivorax TaxID=13658 RepID=A0A915JX04_ROMCU
MEKKLRGKSINKEESKENNTGQRKKIYKGSQNNFLVDNLPPQMNYRRVRVAPVRLTPLASDDVDNVLETYGPWSTPVLLSNSILSTTNQRLHHDSHDGHSYSNSTVKDDDGQPKSDNVWTDRHWAVLIMIIFLAVTIIVAILLQQLVV